MTRSQQLTDEAIRDHWYGIREPDLDKSLWEILNWYSNSNAGTDANARTWLVEFLEAAGRTDEANLIKRVPDEWVPRTAGWLARLGMRGYELTPHNFKILEQQIRDALKHVAAEPVEEKSENGHKPNVQFYIREKASDIIGELEGMIDDARTNPKVFKGWDLFDYLRKNEISTPITQRIIDHFTPIAGELVEVMDTEDTELKEAYSHLSENELFNVAVNYQAMVDGANRYLTFAKNESKLTRKRKAPSMEKILKHFVFLKVDEEHKIASVDPIKIIGAQELWTYNVNSRILTVYRANDSDGLKIKRSAVINVNEQTSFGKRIGRKTEERLKDVLEGGKVKLRHIMDEIKGDQIPIKRITKDTVLLRIV